MKKIALTIFLLLAGFFLLSKQTARAVDEESMIKEEIGKNLKKKHVIKKTWYLDYDNNGRNEAFILTGERLSPKRKDWMPDDTDNDLWFAYVEEDQVKVKKIRRNVGSSAHLLKLKSVTLVCAGNFCATSYPEDVYSVSGDSVHKIFRGDTIHGSEDGDDLVSVHSTYDFSKYLDSGLVTGHTWKPYYFYYNDGKIYEYRGKKISTAAFKKYQNGKTMLKKYKKKGKITGIIYRSNHLIHVNFTEKTKYSEYYSYVTFVVNGSTLEELDMGEGKYAVNMPQYAKEG